MGRWLACLRLSDDSQACVLSIFTRTVSRENADMYSVLWYLCSKVFPLTFFLLFSPSWAARLPGLQKKLLPFLFAPAREWSLPLPPLWAIPSYSFSARRTHQNESEGLARLSGAPGDLHGDVPWKRWTGVLDHQSAALGSPKGEGHPGSSPSTSFHCPGGVYNDASFTGLLSRANFHQSCLTEWGASTGTGCLCYPGTRIHLRVLAQGPVGCCCPMW